MRFNFLLGGIYVYIIFLQCKRLILRQILYQIYKLLLSTWLIVIINFIFSFDILFFRKIIFWDFISLKKWFFYPNYYHFSITTLSDWKILKNLKKKNKMRFNFLLGGIYVQYFYNVRDWFYGKYYIKFTNCS